MFVTIINDCQCENAKARQTTRAASLFDCAVNFCGVKSDIEAAGNLVDVLDASEGKKGVVLVNVAPRNGKAKKWENGTPFGYFFYQDTLVVSTVDGVTLSLVKQLGIVSEVRLVHIPQVLESVKEAVNLRSLRIKQIVNTQFRSFEYLPFVAKWIFDGKKVPYEEYNLRYLENLEPCVWHIDNFGNVKTTLWAHDNFHEFSLKNTVLPFFESLKDVPDNQLAVVQGSSGIGEKRFLEVVLQGGSAAKKLGLEIGEACKV
ncbi:SAM-dependent chlorinase/fluorinase [Candidatus Nomurabacteria bacterium]|nr:SAM-dependent chlorinase/fluorinase [Candidatus Nomurabacteria bacterium]